MLTYNGFRQATNIFINKKSNLIKKKSNFFGKKYSTNKKYIINNITLNNFTIDPLYFNHENAIQKHGLHYNDKDSIFWLELLYSVSNDVTSKEGYIDTYCWGKQLLLNKYINKCYNFFHIVKLEYNKISFDSNTYEYYTLFFIHSHSIVLNKSKQMDVRLYYFDIVPDTLKDNNLKQFFINRSINVSSNDYKLHILDAIYNLQEKKILSFNEI